MSSRLPIPEFILLYFRHWNEELNQLEREQTAKRNADEAAWREAEYPINRIPPAPSNDTMEGYYVVKQGDTLKSIAEDKGLDDWRKLWAANPKLRSPQVIYAGDVLILPHSFTPQQFERFKEQYKQYQNTPGGAARLQHQLSQQAMYDMTSYLRRV